MFQRFQSIRLAKMAAFPAQFWLLFWGVLISTTGASMIWPFLMIYASERLQLPLSTVTGLMTVNSAAGIIFSFVAGPLADRLGRKGVMVTSLIVNGLAYLMLSRADTLPAFALLMGLSGAANPLYRVGSDAMLADLIPQEKRADGYSLLRMSNNVGVALGPLTGGLIAVSSYSIAFYLAAAGLILYGCLIAFLAEETLPRKMQVHSVLSTPPTAARPTSSAGPSIKVKGTIRRVGPLGGRLLHLGGYERVLRDRPFISFTAAFTLTYISAAMMWVLLSVYTKQNFGIPENQYGLLPMTNALMVVFFQYPVTQSVKNRPPLWVMAFGALLYAVGVGSVAAGSGFWMFWGSMVVMTIGELILVPTTATYAAALAPADMRGRYMSIYGLTWGVAIGVGPFLGGLLNDYLGPQAIWWGAGFVGLLGTGVFILLARRATRPTKD